MHLSLKCLLGVVTVVVLNLVEGKAETPAPENTLRPHEAGLTPRQKDTIFCNWTQYKYSEADQSSSVSASVAQDKLTLNVANIQVFRSSTLKSECVASVKIEDIMCAMQFGDFVQIEARPDSITRHSKMDRIHDRGKTLLEDSHTNAAQKCSSFSFTFAGSADPSILAGAAAEDIARFVNRKKAGGPDPVVGKWDWGYYRGDLAQWATINADGTATSTNNAAAHWHVVNELERVYELRWTTHGWVNVVHVSPDGNALVEDYFGFINSRQRSKG